MNTKLINELKLDLDTQLEVIDDYITFISYQKRLATLDKLILTNLKGLKTRITEIIKILEEE